MAGEFTEIKRPFVFHLDFHDERYYEVRNERTHLTKSLFTWVFCQKLNWERYLAFWWFVENWSDITPWLCCSLHRLLTIVSLAEILFIRIASFLGEWPRSTASVQRLSEAYEACSLSEAALLFLPVLFTRLLKQTCSEFLSLDWLFIGLLSPSCFRLTWLMQFLFLKSPLAWFLKRFCLSSLSDHTDYTGLMLFSCREETVRVTHTETILNPIKKSNHFWLVPFWQLPPPP